MELICVCGKDISPLFSYVLARGKTKVRIPNPHAGAP
jgi:hypothetical protein